MLACINRAYRPQRANIDQRTIFVHDIYVNCLNVKEKEEERERKRQYEGQINRRNKAKRRERGKHTTGKEREKKRNTAAMKKQDKLFSIKLNLQKHKNHTR